jgi:hypothetical protein
MRRVRRIALALAAIALYAPAAAPQAGHHHPAGSAEKLGKVNFPTSCTPAAQARFERAVAMLHSFWFEEAHRAFTAIAAADSTCAMAHWGVAMTLWGNPFVRQALPAERQRPVRAHDSRRRNPSDRPQSGTIVPDVLLPFPHERDTSHATPHPVMTLNPAESKATRRMRLERSNGLWVINGETWDDVVRTNYEHVFATVAPNSTEVWEVENSSGGWFHPLHVHLVDFQVLSRNGRPPRPEELGPKDVVYVGEGETVRVVAKFGPHEGRYMIHCHNLVHEDHDMMTHFDVGPTGEDPAALAPAEPLPAPPL